MGDRVARLEALRGLGAIAVLATHCFVAVPWVGAGVQGGMIRAVHVFMNGHTALVIFFAISGYVLGLSLDRGRGKPGNFSSFYYRRVFRIYPAHLVALLVITAALACFDQGAWPQASAEIFKLLFPKNFDLKDWFLNALLLRVNLNGVAWSLALEMAISLIFPVLYLISRRGAPWVRAAVLLGLILLSFGVGKTLVVDYGLAFVIGLPQGLARDVAAELTYVFEIVNRTAFYGYIFFAGLVAEPVFEKLIARIEGRLGTLLLWLAIMLAFLATAFTGGRLTAWSLLLRGAAGVFVVFCAVFMQTRNLPMRMLDRPFVRNLGTISYSFYLYHFIVHYCIAHALFRVFHPDVVRTFPFFFELLIFVPSFAITYVLARYSYRYVEAPTIAYSKRPSLSSRRSARSSE